LQWCSYSCGSHPRSVANALARSLEWQYSPPTDIPAADAIVVLGGGTEPAIPPRRSVEINSAGDRVFAAAQLYRDGKAPVLILSGGNIDWLSSTASTPATRWQKCFTFMDILPLLIWKNIHRIL
jgi:uncharacterized SAM-binding protein YcdF (DUF218 family)